MKKSFYVGLITFLLAAQVLAQGDVESRLDSELQRVYDTEENVTKSRKTKNDGSNIIIYNNQDQVAKQNAIHDQQTVQDQPTTYVQASPLLESESSKIRNARKQMEVQTEEKIVEKLEYSRIEDEKRRADKLFGNKLDSLSSDDSCNDPCSSSVLVCQKKCVKEDKKEVIIVKADDLESTVTTKTIIADEVEEVQSAQNYIFGVVGTQDYTGVKNVQAGTAFGVGIGMGFSSNFALEGSVTYSQADLEDQTRRIVSRGVRSHRASTLFPNVKVDQLGFMGALKYVMKWNRIKPFIGGTLGGMYRMYQDEVELVNSNVNNTLSFDAGITAGLDVAITNNFSVGADVRFAQNISHNRDKNSIDRVFSENVKPLEEMSYQSLLLNAKFNF